MARLIRQTAKRQGVGDAVSLGPNALAKRFEAPELSMSAKGISIQNTDPRAEPAWGLLNATDSSGSCAHIWVYGDLVCSLADTGISTLVTPESTPSEIAEKVKYKQDLVAALDSLQVCAFSNYAFTLEDYVKGLNNITGIKLTPEGLLAIGERIFRLEREFNRGHGFSSADDTLPDRFLTTPLPSGLHRGKVCELGPMLREYEKARGRTRGAFADLPSLF